MTFKSSGLGGRFVSKGNGFPISPLNPSSRSDLVAWYKADSLGLSNGSTVTSWPDDSPNNNDLDSYENTPIYNSSDALLNGMPSVTYFGNSSNYKSNPTGLPVGSNACTTYVVGYWSGASSNTSMFTWGSNAYNGARMGAGYYGGLIFENGGIATQQRSLSINTPFIFSYPYVAGANTTAAVTHLNGVSATGEYPGLSGVANISNPVAEIAIGRPATAPVERWTGAVAEVIVFNTTHDAFTRESIEKYLSNKYGISTVSSAIRPSGFKAKILTSAPPESPIVTSGLILYLDAGNPVSYPGSGTMWTDLSGNGKHATLYNSPTYSASNGGLIVFSKGSSQYAEGGGLGSQPVWTASVWARIDEAMEGNGALFTDVYGGNVNFAIASLGGNEIRGAWYGGWTATSPVYVPVIGEWHNHTVTNDGTTLKHYVDGVLYGTTSTGPSSGNNIGYRVARRWDYTPYVSAAIPIVLAYDRALSQPEIIQNFDANKARYGL